jgi:hypothetical protein
LDGGSAGRKTSAYTGQEKHRKNVDYTHAPSRTGTTTCVRLQSSDRAATVNGTRPVYNVQTLYVVFHCIL